MDVLRHSPKPPQRKRRRALSFFPLKTGVRPIHPLSLLHSPATHPGQRRGPPASPRALPAAVLGLGSDWRKRGRHQQIGPLAPSDRATRVLSQRVCRKPLCKPCPAGVFHRLCCVRGDTKPSALFLAPPGEGNTHSAADTGDSGVQKWEVTLAETWGCSSCSPTASVLSIKPEPTFCWVMLLCLCGKQRGKESGRDSGNTASVYFLSGRMLYFCLFIPSDNRVKNIYSLLSALPP